MYHIILVLQDARLCSAMLHRQDHHKSLLKLYSHFQRLSQLNIFFYSIFFSFLPFVSKNDKEIRIRRKLELSRNCDESIAKLLLKGCYWLCYWYYSVRAECNKSCVCFMRLKIRISYGACFCSQVSNSIACLPL